MFKNLQVLAYLILLFISKTSGQITFQKSFGPFSSESAIVEKTKDSGYIVMSRQFLKLNETGDTMWTRHYDFGTSYTLAGHQTFDGGYAISGGRVTSAGGHNCFLAKVDSVGHLIWSREYGGSN